MEGSVKLKTGDVAKPSPLGRPARLVNRAAYE